MSNNRVVAAILTPVLNNGKTIQSHPRIPSGAAWQ